MQPVNLPETFLALLGASAPCFRAPTYQNCVTLVRGWVHCLGRRTLTAVVLASGAVGTRHVSMFHRFFGRAEWALDDLGRVLFRLPWPGSHRSSRCTCWSTTRWRARAARGSRWRRCTATRCCRPPASRSSASATSGSSWRCGSPWRWAVRLRPAAPIPALHRLRARRAARSARPRDDRGAAAGGAGRPSAGAPAADEA
jgi:hypothetical protein